MNAEDRTAYLAPGRYVDSDHPAIKAFADEVGGGEREPLPRALRIFYAVRDRVLYDPYNIDLTPAGFTASACLARGKGFCVTKAAILCAVARAAGLPARLGYADVRNHLATERMVKAMGTDLFIYHGYVDLFLEGKWVKATPAFNLSLCERFRVKPLDFDGRTDSIFHPYDADGRRHMEYVNNRGVYADVPFDEIEREFKTVYPVLFGDGSSARVEGDFAADAEAESRRKAAAQK